MYLYKIESSLNLKNFIDSNFVLEFLKIKELGFKTPKNIFKPFEIIGQFKNGNTVLKNIKNNQISNLFKNNYKFVLIKKGENKTIWKNRYLENSILITNNSYYKYLRNLLSLKSFELGKAKLIHQYVQLILKEMNVIYYKDVIVPDEFKKEYNDNRKINYEAKRKIKGKISCLTYVPTSNYKIDKSFFRGEKELNYFYKLKSEIIIYCTNTDKQNLIEFIKIIQDFSFNINISFIIVSNVNKEILDNLTIKNLINLDSIMLHKKFKKLITYYYLTKKYNKVLVDLNVIDIEIIKNINVKYYNLLKEAKLYLYDKRTSKIYSDNSEFFDECVNVGLKYNLLNNNIINVFEEISFLFKLTPFIQKIKYLEEEETRLYFKQVINYYLMKKETNSYPFLYKLRPNVYSNLLETNQENILKTNQEN